MLLTIDPSTGLGWTIGPFSPDTPNDQVSFGTVKLSTSTDVGAYLQSADEALQDLMSRGITAWAIEVMNTQRSYHHAIVKGVAIYSHCLYTARLLQLPPPTVFSPTEIKTTMTGNGLAKKPEIIAAAQLLGFDVKTDHEADAIGIRRAYIFGVPEGKTERLKREAKERREAKEAAKGAKLL